MDSLIGIGVMGTFGQPSKYQQEFYFDVNFHKSLDVRSHGIKPGPDAVLFAVRKEVVDGVQSLCFCKYTYTEELNVTGDFFIGCCVVLQGGFTTGQNIYRLLLELNDDMVGNPLNLYYNIIRVNGAAAVIVREPVDYLAVRMNTSRVTDTFHASSSAIDERSRFLILPGSDHAGNMDKMVIDFFDHAIMSFPEADALYLTTDDQLVTDVMVSGTMPVLAWEQFMYHYRPQGLALPTTKKQARVVAPLEVDEEPHIPEEETVAPPPEPAAPEVDVNSPDVSSASPEALNVTIVPQVVEKVADNSSAGDEDEMPAAITERVDEGKESGEITADELATHPKGGTDEVAPHEENPVEATELRTDELVTTVPEIMEAEAPVKVPDDAPAAIDEQESEAISHTETVRQYRVEDEETTAPPKKVPFYKRDDAPKIYLFMFLGFVVLYSVFYYLGSRKTKAPEAPLKVADTVMKVTQPDAKSGIDTLAISDTVKKDTVVNKDSLIAALKAELANPKIKELSPRPNMELSPLDIVKLKQAGLQYKLLSEVVHMIFEHYPENVGIIYKGQEKEYSQKLMNLNKGCFQKVGDDYMYAHDSIAHIPAYKNKHLPEVAPR